MYSLLDVVILIPTYNRSKFLKNNINSLRAQIYEHDLEHRVGIVLSDNHSSDDTIDVIEEFSSNVNFYFRSYTQESNIGAVNNVLFLLKEAEHMAKYILFLGDDDILSSNYVNKVIELIDDNLELSVIIPSNIAVDTDGNLMGYGRDLGNRNRFFKKGFYSCLKNSWRGHQISGLVFPAEKTYSLCEKYNIKNMYFFVFIVAYYSLRGELYHLVDSPVKVCRPDQKAKGWSYGDDGLISEFYDNYKRLPGIHFIKRVLLEIYLLDKQYWRYSMYLKLSLYRFVCAVRLISTGSNTSIVTRIMCPILIPIIMLKKTVEVLLKGEIVTVLKRKVDIE